MNANSGFYLLILPDQETAKCINSWIVYRSVLSQYYDWKDLAEHLQALGVEVERIEFHNPQVGFELKTAQKWVEENQVTNPVVVLRESANDPVDIRIGWINW